MSGFDETLLEILVCPIARTPLRYDAGGQELICEESGLAYPIRDGVPVMLVEEARKVLHHAAHGEGDQPQAGGGVEIPSSEDPAQGG